MVATQATEAPEEREALAETGLGTREEGHFVLIQPWEVGALNSLAHVETKYQCGNYLMIWTCIKHNIPVVAIKKGLCLVPKDIPRVKYSETTRTWDTLFYVVNLNLPSTDSIVHNCSKPQGNEHEFAWSAISTSVEPICVRWRPPHN